MFSNELWNKSGVPATFSIDQSIRFNVADSSYMSRTFGTATSLTTTTLSLWVKRGNLGTHQMIMVGSTSAYGDTLYFFFNTSDQLKVVDGGSYVYLTSTQVFRDPSAWLHIVFVLDTGNSTSSERFRFYVNGQRITNYSSSFPAQNATYKWNSSTGQHSIGCYLPSPAQLFDGYMTEIVFIDGQALDPSNFAETNDSGIWVPKDVSGLTFGNNGFHIDGRDSSDLGDDESGNGNDFTTSGLAAHDQVLDSPTNNFCVMNPLNTHSSMTLSNGNLQSTASAFTGSGASILLPSTGKWYCEMRYNNASLAEYPMMGIYNTIKNLSTTAINTGSPSGDKDIGFGANGLRRENGTDTLSWGNAIGDGKIGALAVDMDNKKIWFGHNNSGSFVWQASGNPSTGSNEANTIAFANDVIFGNSHYSSSIVCWNFGQDGTFGGTETAQGNSDANGVGNFYFTVPTGYQALCTKNIGA